MYCFDPDAKDMATLSTIFDLKCWIFIFPQILLASVEPLCISLKSFAIVIFGNNGLLLMHTTIALRAKWESSFDFDFV